MSQGCGDELFGQKRAQRLVGVLRRREHRSDRPSDPAPDLQQLGPRRFRRKDERQVEVVVVRDGVGVKDLNNGRFPKMSHRKQKEGRRIECQC